MSFLATKSDLVHRLGVKAKQACDGADEITRTVRHALALSELDSDAAAATQALAEDLERISAILRNQAIEIEQTQAQAKSEISANRIDSVVRTFG